MNLASAGSDYNSAVRFLTSPSGGIECLNITIIDDSVALEGNESFMVVLSTSDPYVVLGNSQQVITIIDNEGE